MLENVKASYRSTQDIFEDLKTCGKQYGVSYQGRLWAIKKGANYCATTIKAAYIFVKLIVSTLIDTLCLPYRLIKGVSPVTHTRAVTHTRDGMPIMDPRATGLLYKMHKEFDRVCQEHGIDYFACSGTTLGALRQNPSGIIPWDDDMDLGLPLNEEDKFTEAFKKDLLACGLKLRPHWGGYKLTMLKCPSFGTTYGTGRPNGEFYWPFIDLFHTYENQDDGRIYINTIGKPNAPTDRPSTCWPKESWTKEEIANAKRVTFGPNTIPLTQGANGYVERAYGKDCKEMAMQMFDHKNGKPFDEPKIVKITDFKPAPYDISYFRNSLPKA